MKKRDILKKLETVPLFTFNDFIKLSGFKKNYAWLYILRLKREGLIFKIEKGKYTVYTDPIVFSSYIATPSYLSFWTAFRFYNFTEQLPLNITIVSPKSKKSMIFNGTKIRFFKLKDFWGYKKLRYNDFDIFMAEKEKCIIDALLMQNTPFDEIIKAIKTKDYNIDKLILYAIKTENKSLLKRIGYILDFFGFKADSLLNCLDNNYILLDFKARSKGKKNKKWKIIENRGLNDID